MIIVISPEKPVTEEIPFVNSLFANGLELFHVRKYNFSDGEMKAYLTGIEGDYHHHVVLHSHYHWADEFGITRLHFREEERLNRSYLDYIGYQLSTSVHCIEDFNALEAIWDYAFLSPVFPSISKSGYGEDGMIMNDLKRKNNPNVKLIGLGGIQADNCRQVVDCGADGIALLGSIWNRNDSLNTFLACRKIVQSY